MTAHDASSVVDYYLNHVIGEQQLGQLELVCDEHIVAHGTRKFGTVRGLEEIRQRLVRMFSVLSDCRLTVDGLFCSGDMVAARTTSRARHAGTFGGIPPTHQEVVWTAIYVFRVHDRKIAEMWWQEDYFGILDQLGVTIASPAAGAPR